MTRELKKFRTNIVKYYAIKKHYEATFQIQPEQIKYVITKQKHWSRHYRRHRAGTDDRNRHIPVTFSTGARLHRLASEAYRPRCRSRPLDLASMPPLRFRHRQSSSSHSPCSRSNRRVRSARLSPLTSSFSPVSSGGAMFRRVRPASPISRVPTVRRPRAVRRQLQPDATPHILSPNH